MSKKLFYYNEEIEPMVRKAAWIGVLGGIIGVVIGVMTSFITLIAVYEYLPD